MGGPLGLISSNNGDLVFDNQLTNLNGSFVADQNGNLYLNNIFIQGLSIFDIFNYIAPDSAIQQFLLPLPINQFSLTTISINQFSAD